jgi:outer membrane protein
MKTRQLTTVILLLFLTECIVFSQEKGSELTLSLKEAQDYAIQHNKMVISAQLDVQSSKLALWEIISAGLPQVDATGSFTDNLKLMTTLLPGEFFGKPGEKIPVTFGSKFNSGASVQASMLLFSAPFWVGIETTKLAQRLSKDNLEKSELDTKESIGTAYFLILVSEKSLDILNGNIANLNETLKSTKAMM